MDNSPFVSDISVEQYDAFDKTGVVNQWWELDSKCQDQDQDSEAQDEDQDFEAQDQDQDSEPTNQDISK